MLTEANIFYYKKAIAKICSICGKSFKHSSSLSRHRTNAHKDKEFKCDVCQEQLSSKCSLDRHRRVKHNISGKFEYVPYVKKEDKDNTEEESEGVAELGNYNNIDSNKNVYNNNTGWVETDNKEEIDNSESGESNMELDNKEEIDNNGDNMDMDNNSSGSEESIMEGMRCTKELDFQHKLFDVIETCKDMCDKFGNCDNLATFQIHPSPVGMGCANKYIEWMRELFTGILDYFSQKYTPDAEDYISFGMLHAEHPDKCMWVWMRKYIKSWMLKD